MQIVEKGRDMSYTADLTIEYKHWSKFRDAVILRGLKIDCMRVHPVRDVAYIFIYDVDMQEVFQLGQIYEKIIDNNEREIK